MLARARRHGHRTAPSCPTASPGCWRDAVRAAGIDVAAGRRAERGNGRRVQARPAGLSPGRATASAAPRGRWRFVSSNPWDAFGACELRLPGVLGEPQRRSRTSTVCAARATELTDLAALPDLLGVTPAARIAAAIELLAAIEAAPRTARRRGRQRLLPRPALHRLRRPARGVGAGLAGAARPPPAGLVACARPALRRQPAAAGGRRRCCWKAGALDGVAQSFSGGRFAPGAADRGGAGGAAARWRATRWTIPAMPDAVRLEVPGLAAARACRPASATRWPPSWRRCCEPAPLDLRVNLLKATREEARAALAAEGIEAAPTPLSPWGLRIAGRRPVTTGAAFQSGLVEIQDEGSQLVAALVGARPGHAGGRLVRRRRRQDAGAGDDDAQPRPDRRLRRLRAAAGSARCGGCAAPACTMSSATCSSPATNGPSGAPAASIACWWTRPAPAPAPGGATPTRGCG